MQIPAVAFLEMALDSLIHADEGVIAKEIREFKALGVSRLGTAQSARALHPLTRMQFGYLLGLETARVLLQTMPAAQQAGIEI